MLWSDYNTVTIVHRWVSVDRAFFMLGIADEVHARRVVE
jgi:hypothetical protein